MRIARWFSDQQLDILAKGRRVAAERIEDEVLQLLANRWERQHLDYVTARDVHRARIVSTADVARKLLDRMECEGILVGEDIKPEHGGKTTRVYRTAKNPVQA